jgi:hypothetical protein
MLEVARALTDEVLQDIWEVDSDAGARAGNKHGGDDATMA